MGIDFSELLRRAKTGDRDALGELHERYARLVSGVVRRHMSPALRRRFDCEDIVQSVFADACARLPAFEDRGEEAFRHWLCMLAETKLRSKLRRHREATLGDEAGAGPPCSGPATLAGDADEREQMEAVLGRLEPEHRELLLLRASGGLGFDEIAQRLGIASAAAARMRYARALIVLRDRWDDH